MEEQAWQGNTIGAACRYCGAGEDELPVNLRGDHVQVVVACFECGNDYAAISRN